MYVIMEVFLILEIEINSVEFVVQWLACIVKIVGSNPRLFKTKEYKIIICCFITKHAALRNKNKDWIG